MLRKDRTLRVITKSRNGVVNAAAVLAMVAAGAGGAMAQAVAPDDPMGLAVFHDSAGNEVGVAALVETPHGVLIQAAFDGLPGGAHAFHLHAVGVCEAPDFASAAGHYNPHGAEHGFWNPDGPHAGDLPNIYVPDSGQLRVDMITDRVTLGEGESTLFDDDGTAIVLHDGPDDYATGPAGAAGPRIACAVVELGTGADYPADRLD